MIFKHGGPRALPLCLEKKSSDKNEAWGTFSEQYVTRFHLSWRISSKNVDLESKTNGTSMITR